MLITEKANQLSASTFIVTVLSAAATVSLSDAPTTTTIITPAVTSDHTAQATAPTASEIPTTDASDEIIVTARRHAPQGDPLASINAASFVVVQAVDKAVIDPVINVYERRVPRPVRSGVHNVINNLDEPIVFVNFLLQHKIGKAAATFARFLTNSTIGAGGLFDVAKKHPFNLRRRANGFANTLGFYGVKPGPYLFLPGIGATTLRDVFGRSVDLLMLPTAAGAPFNRPAFSLPNRALSALDERIELRPQLEMARQSNPDTYSAIREYYLKRRAAEIAALHTHRHARPAIVPATPLVAMPTPPPGT